MLGARDDQQNELSRQKTGCQQIRRLLTFVVSRVSVSSILALRIVDSTISTGDEGVTYHPTDQQLSRTSGQGPAYQAGTLGKHEENWKGLCSPGSSVGYPCPQL